MSTRTSASSRSLTRTASTRSPTAARRRPRRGPYAPAARARTQQHPYRSAGLVRPTGLVVPEPPFEPRSAHPRLIGEGDSMHVVLDVADSRSWSSGELVGARLTLYRPGATLRLTRSHRFQDAAMTSHHWYSPLPPRYQRADLAVRAAIATTFCLRLGSDSLATRLPGAASPPELGPRRVSSGSRCLDEWPTAGRTRCA